MLSVSSRPLGHPRFSFSSSARLLSAPFTYLRTQNSEDFLVKQIGLKPDGEAVGMRKDSTGVLDRYCLDCPRNGEGEAPSTMSSLLT